MRWREIMETASAGATAAGSVAAVAQPMGRPITRSAISELDKYKIMKSKHQRKHHNAGR